VRHQRESRDRNFHVVVLAVTLLLTVFGRESMWMMADRRLSFEDGTWEDTARKVMILETTDAVAILGYAGLGATARGTEPADWMSAVLRGRNLPLEQSLSVLAEAMKKQFPIHMVQLPGKGGPAHNIFISAFIGNEPRVYTIDLVFAPDRKNYYFRHTRHVVDKPKSGGPRTPRLGIAGSGAFYLQRDRKWARSLFRLIRANDRKQASSYAVADHLATLNYEVHLGVSDNSVGPSCIVVWRNRKEGIYKGGGAHQFYTGTTRDVDIPSLPKIANGVDISAVIDVLTPRLFPILQAMQGGEPANSLDEDELNVELARLPDKPDEILR
jgi:hypothetical protein